MAMLAMTGDHVHIPSEGHMQHSAARMPNKAIMTTQRKTHRATRPTGNCRPALEDWLTAFLAVFPLPRPDMVADCSLS